MTAAEVGDKPADQLRALAARVRRLGVSGRTDPKAVVVEELTLAAELDRSPWQPSERRWERGEMHEAQQETGGRADTERPKS